MADGSALEMALVKFRQVLRQRDRAATHDLADELDRLLMAELSARRPPALVALWDLICDERRRDLPSWRSDVLALLVEVLPAAPTARTFRGVEALARLFAAEPRLRWKEAARLAGFTSAEAARRAWRRHGAGQQKAGKAGAPASALAQGGPTAQDESTRADLHHGATP